jgi:hypothetical protein
MQVTVKAANNRAGQTPLDWATGPRRIGPGRVKRGKPFLQSRDEQKKQEDAISRSSSPYPPVLSRSTLGNF